MAYGLWLMDKHQLRLSPPDETNTTMYPRLPTINTRGTQSPVRRYIQPLKTNMAVAAIKASVRAVVDMIGNVL